LTKNHHAYNDQFNKQIMAYFNQIGLLNQIGFLSGKQKKEYLVTNPSLMPNEKLNFNSHLLPIGVQYNSVPEKSVQ
jgi:hypothetical protein